jgi:two-component system phosphate regulon sensor histidine kinase PhoR
LDGVTTEKRERLASRLWLVLEHSPIGAAIADPGGNLLQVNIAMGRIVGSPPRELVGRSVADLARPGECGRQGAEEPVETSYARADGSTVPVSELRSVVPDEDGDPAFVVLQVQDLTERDAAHSAREFLALTGHEMRSPLTSILGFAQTLRDSTAGMSAEETEAALAAIERQARRLDDVVSDLLARASRQMG